MCFSKGLAKCVLFVFNIVFWLTGAALLGIGIWMKVDRTIVNYLLVVNISQSDPLIDHAAWVFIGVGALTFVVGFCGCCGAIRESQCLLFCYATLLLIIMAIELVGAILALIYRKKIESHLGQSMMEQVKYQYSSGNGSSVTQSWDFLQTKLKCCGANHFTDYRNSKWWNDTRGVLVGPLKKQIQVPFTCCVLKNDDPDNPEVTNLDACQEAAKSNTTSDQIHQTGCHKALGGWFQRNSLILMCIGFGIAAIQIVGFVLACCLRTAIKRTSSEKFA